MANEKGKQKRKRSKTTEKSFQEKLIKQSSGLNLEELFF
jgi:hypothetical protein